MDHLCYRDIGIYSTKIEKKRFSYRVVLGKKE